MKVPTWFMAVVFLISATAPAFAGEQDQNTTVTNKVNSDAAVTFAPQSNGNINGEFPNANGMSPGLLQYFIQSDHGSFNALNPNELFRAVPRDFTRQMFEVYASNRADWKKVKKEVEVVSMPFVQYPVTDSVRTIKTEWLMTFEEGKDYIIVNPAVSRAKDNKHANGWDVGLMTLAEMMNRGCNGVAYYTANTEDMIKSKTGSESILAAFATLGEIGAEIFTGGNITPGIGRSSGDTRKGGLPYLRAVGIRVINPAIFDEDESSKVQQAQAAPQPEPQPQPAPAPPTPKVEEPDYYGELAKCPLPGQNNAELHFKQGMRHWENAKTIQDHKGRVTELGIAFLHLDQAIEDGLQGERLKDAHYYLSGIWYFRYQDAIAENNPQVPAFLEHIEKHAKKSGKNIPKL